MCHEESSAREARAKILVYILYVYIRGAHVSPPTLQAGQEQRVQESIFSCHAPIRCSVHMGELCLCEGFA